MKDIFQILFGKQGQYQQIEFIFKIVGLPAARVDF